MNATTITLEYKKELSTSGPANSDFSGTKTVGTTETDLTFSSTAPAISGNTVTLTLAASSSVSATDTDVKLSYAGSASTNPIRDVSGKSAATLTNRDVGNAFADAIVPERVATDPVLAPRSRTPPATTPRTSGSRPRSLGSSPLNVNLSVVQDDTYVTNTTTMHTVDAVGAPPNLEVNLAYAGNTSGNLTYTLEPGAGYAVALAPNDTATVMVKAPASGRAVRVKFSDTDVRVSEGGVARVPVTFTLPSGLATPRDAFTIGFALADEDAVSGSDFVAFPQTGLYIGPEPGDWEPAAGGGRTFTGTVPVETIEDTDVEANEVFFLDFLRSSFYVDVIHFSDVDDNVAISILDDDPLVVESVAVSSTPTSGYYGAGDTIEFTVTFSGLVTVDAGPRTL